MNDTWWVKPSDLDPSQMAVLTEPPDTQMLIVGPPGSGKTNILLLRANYVRSVAPRMVFALFTRTLTEFLRAGPNLGRADQLQRDEVTTFMAWGRRLIRDHGGEISTEDSNFEEARSEVIDELERMISAGQLGELYDVVFIDEVQDFRAAELEIIRHISAKINASGDSRQDTYKHFEGLPAIKAMVDKTVELTSHYRVGEQICSLADQILPPREGESPLSAGCMYPEEVRESSVISSMADDNDAMFADCIARLKTQRRYISDEPIGVLSATQKLRDDFWEALSADAELGPVSIVQRSEEYQAFGPNSLIRVMTVAAAKGSEFRAVHLLGAEGFGANRRELAFTAVTRAKTELVLHHVAPLPGHMRPRNDSLPTIDSIF